MIRGISECQPKSIGRIGSWILRGLRSRDIGMAIPFDIDVETFSLSWFVQRKEGHIVRAEHAGVKAVIRAECDRPLIQILMGAAHKAEEENAKKAYQAGLCKGSGFLGEWEPKSDRLCIVGGEIHEQSHGQSQPLVGRGLQFIHDVRTYAVAYSFEECDPKKKVLDITSGIIQEFILENESSSAGGASYRQRK